ncbi:polysaccharide biosynthesis protein [Chitinophaga arvensicola]|uniref:NDP-sugar epimerase, includes UDP-GlcNAc-inverting 4,6-dehydratase FlaA1 and capsular polysaccharide biosynthesis protein EpsC n=1 Tax=Chitinophaga arvensicola TaxID=29529 RepID=A0A1I0S8Y2_9BACT|nr:nucleoside-diphosphate sugar epimerase/dehydratase [Chitinophaga arvensicola]SEW52489.1 NDP-sugar epimerase, includes UDP-GlcNAc-inverting 4,6-dehydratase FlaA1 and capsular polysaccharide biosynthesis protein EpsC [Chitinophaga arvensicola]
MVHKSSWITPSWLILLLDLGCSVIAINVAFLLRLNFDAEAYLSFPLEKIGFAVLAINLFLSLLLRTYRGIVRFTSLADIGRIAGLNFISSFMLFTLRYSTLFDDKVNVFPISVILINFFICSFFLLSYRLSVKWIFKYYKNFRTPGRTCAAIYYTGHSSLMLRKAISDAPGSGIKVIAFLADTNAHAGKSIEGLPVYASRKGQLFKMVKEGKISLLLIPNDHLDAAHLSELVEECIALNIKVQKIIPVSQWTDGSNNNNIQLKDINIEDLLERSVICIKNQEISHELKGKSVLVTGAAGSIGSEIVRQLVNYKPSVIVLCDKAESPLHELELEMSEKMLNVSIIPFIGDVCDKVRMQQLFDIYAPAIVYHAAAYKHVPMMEKNPSVAVMNNVLGTKVVAELSVEYGAEKFVMVSTDKAVNPTNIMGASKRIAEIFSQSFNNYLNDQYLKMGPVYGTPPTRFITTRFGNVLGSNGSVIPRFKQQLEKGGPLTVTHPEITRYFMTIPEACQLVLEAGAMGQGGEIFVFDMGQPMKIAELARKMIRMSGKEPGKDIQVVFTGLRPGEKLYEELLNNAENTLPTYHEKIMIAKVRASDFGEVNEQVNQLIASARKHYLTPTVLKMKQLVPEFISKNSAFEELDKGDKIKM